MESQHSKPARKILVIGGSTYNKNTTENTPMKIRQAFIDSGFLDEWAVIIAIHQFLKLNTKKPLDEFVTTRKSELSLPGTFEPKIFFITEPRKYTIETGCIYVLPDPVPELVRDKNDEKLLHTGFLNDVPLLHSRFISDDDDLKISAENSEDSQKEFDNWLTNHQFDVSGKQRQITAGDVLEQKYEKLPFLSDFNDFRKFREKIRIAIRANRSAKEDVIYRDMPFIDKFMSEVADSKSKPKIAALLLCGRFGDGAEGLKKIKENGGYTAVQFPGECFNDPSKPMAPTTASMPTTALNIEPNHRIVTLENEAGYLKLSEWLDEIK